MTSSRKRKILSVQQLKNAIKFVSCTSVMLKVGASFGIETSTNPPIPFQYEFAAIVQIEVIANAAEVSAGTSDFGSQEITVQSLSDVQQISSPFKRKLALYGLLSKATDKQVLKLLAESYEVEPRERIQVQKTILQRLTQLNPKKAYAQIELLNENDRSQLIYAVFTEWSTQNLEEAVSFATSLDDSERFTALESILMERSELPEEELRRIARQLGDEQYATNLIMQQRLSNPIDNPEEMWDELVDEVQDHPGQFWMLATVARAWIESDGVGILDDIYDSISNTQTRKYVLGSALQLAAQHDPDSALDYALKWDDGTSGLYSLTSTVVKTWVRSDPQSALDAASRIEKFGLRRRLEESVVREWGYQQPRGLLSHFDSLPEHLYNVATRAAIPSLVLEDPREATDFVASLDGPSRAPAASALVGSWSRGTDYRGAIEWVLNEPDIEDLKPLLFQQVLMNLVHIDP